MYTYVKIAYAVAFCGIISLLGANTGGFFKKLSDDPTWTNPKPTKTAAGATVAAGGDAAGGPGAGIFSQRCATCHQGKGQGLPGVYPPLAGSEIAQGEPSRPVRIILNGFAGKISRGGKEYNGVMTPHRDLLSDDEISQVLTFVRSSWGNKGDAVDAAFVKEVREKTATKAGAWTEAELEKPL